MNFILRARTRLGSLNLNCSDKTRRDGTGGDGTGREETGWDGTGGDGTGRDGTRRDETRQVYIKPSPLLSILP
jgi:hypothetical protein